MVPKKPMTTNASRFARVENPRGWRSKIDEAGGRLAGPGGGKGGVLVAHGLTDVCGMGEAGARSRHASRIAFMIPLRG